MVVEMPEPTCPCRPCSPAVTPIHTYLQSPALPIISQFGKAFYGNLTFKTKYWGYYVLKEVNKACRKLRELTALQLFVVLKK